MENVIHVSGYDLPIIHLGYIPKCIRPVHVHFCKYPLFGCISSICKGALLPYNPIIPISKEAYINLPARRCPKCHRVFSDQAAMLEDVLRLAPTWLIIDNQDSSFRHIATKQRDAIRREEARKKAAIEQEKRRNEADAEMNKAMLEYDLSSMVYAFAIYGINDVQIHFIITEYKKRNEANHIWHYTSLTARKLMTTLVTKQTRIEIDGKEYCVDVLVDRYKDSDAFRIIDTYGELIIKNDKGAGYYSQDPNIIEMDGLVMCMQTQCLEWMWMSYNIEQKILFINEAKFKRYLAEKGFPVVRELLNYDHRFTNLKPRSTLSYLGYNVNSLDNLNAQQRQMILSSAVDSGLMEISEITQLLSTLIKMGKDVRPDAVLKWKCDLEFIENYRRTNNRLFILHGINY